MIRQKHKVVAVRDLGIGNLNTPIRFLDNQLPVFGNNTLGKYGNNIINDKNIVVETINAGGYGPNSCLMYFSGDSDDYGSRRYFYLDFDYKVALLQGSSAELILKKKAKLTAGLTIDNLRHTFNIGADPEFFVEDEKGIMIPAFDFLQSKKDNPHVYWDGFQGEFTITAGGCLEGRVYSTQEGLMTMLSLAKKVNKNARISNKTLFMIDSERLQSAADEHVSLGCMPSFNVYGDKGLEVTDPRQLPFRSAGGHMHFGFGDAIKLHQDKERIERIIKALDKVVGVACVSLLANYDKAERRQYYGKAGEFRTPKHGLEYRTLSNAWMYHPLTMNIVFDLARKVVMMGERNMIGEWSATEKETVDCINNCDVKKARKILARNKVVFIKLLTAAYGAGRKEVLAKVFQVFMKGIDTLVDTSDINKNWELATFGNVTHNKSFRANQDKINKGQKVA